MSVRTTDVAAYGQAVSMPPATRELSRRAAIVGVGESDFHADYMAERARAPGYRPPMLEDLLERAFERALADSGLPRDRIDGLALSCTYGGPPPEAMAGRLGLKPRYLSANGNIMAGPLPRVCADIAADEADHVAMIFGVAPRSGGRQYGGATFSAGVGPLSYYYYHPWGWSSQAAHWAFMFSHYQAKYGVREEDLGAVAVQVRQHACGDPNAIMQQPLTIAGYMASRYVVRPLHLLDICLVNDGAVCLIVSKAELAAEAAKVPVLVAGWGEAKVKAGKMAALVHDRLRTIMQDAGRQALEMAGLELAEVGHFEGYDPATIHLVNQVEGFGFVPPGEGIAFCQAGEMGLGGRLPTNTAGGNLSGSYMQGWSQIAEVVRQLRGEAGPRQIAGLNVSMSSLAQTSQVNPLVFTKGE
jgi:acetyl-CoA acetyltransferase